MSVHPPLIGLRHIALYVENLEECAQFYIDMLGMRVDWQPDPDNIYLTSGSDNLALHRATETLPERGRLDHIGFFVPKAADVDAWYQTMVVANVTLCSVPKTHRDGARSFYCKDPAGNVIQLLHIPTNEPA